MQYYLSQLSPGSNPNDRPVFETVFEMKRDKVPVTADNVPIVEKKGPVPAEKLVAQCKPLFAEALFEGYHRRMMRKFEDFKSNPQTETLNERYPDRRPVQAFFEDQKKEWKKTGCLGRLNEYLEQPMAIEGLLQDFEDNIVTRERGAAMAVDKHWNGLRPPCFQELMRPTTITQP